MSWSSLAGRAALDTKRLESKIQNGHRPSNRKRSSQVRIVANACNWSGTQLLHGMQTFRFLRCLLKLLSSLRWTRIKPACGIITRQGTCVSARVHHGLKNSSSYFHSIIPSLFGSKIHSMKARIDDFTLHTHTESEVIEHPENIFKICKEYHLFLSAKKSYHT